MLVLLLLWDLHTVYIYIFALRDGCLLYSTLCQSWCSVAGLLWDCNKKMFWHFVLLIDFRVKLFPIIENTCWSSMTLIKLMVVLFLVYLSLYFLHLFFKFGTMSRLWVQIFWKGSLTYSVYSPWQPTQLSWTWTCWCTRSLIFWSLTLEKLLLHKEKLYLALF